MLFQIQKVFDHNKSKYPSILVYKLPKELLYQGLNNYDHDTSLNEDVSNLLPFYFLTIQSFLCPYKSVETTLTALAAFKLFLKSFP